VHPANRPIVAEPSWAWCFVDTRAVGGTVWPGNHSEQAAPEVLAHGAQIRQHRHDINGTGGTPLQQNHRSYRCLNGKVHQVEASEVVVSYKVVHCGTGNIGAVALRAILEHPAESVRCLPLRRLSIHNAVGTGEQIGRETMRHLTRFVTTAAAIVVATPAALFTTGTGPAAAGPSAGSGTGTLVPFGQIIRRCDFSYNTFTGPTGYGRATAFVRTSSNEVVADVDIATAVPNTHYDVLLIQMPRPSSSPCGAGDPGVAYGSLFTDGAGAASTTVRGNIESGATGVWMFIGRPSAFAQPPAEFYTSDYVAAI
jgi:hypothetical protein